MYLQNKLGDILTIMQYCATDVIWKTRDDQLNFQAYILEEGMMYVAASMVTPMHKLLVEAGLITPPTIIPARDRRSYLRAAKHAAEEAGHYLDTRCWRYVVWETSDGKWRLFSTWETNKRCWGIAHHLDNISSPGYNIFDKLFPTRDKAVEWAQANTTVI